MLKEIVLDVLPGKLVMVIGPVGSGKTSLLAALLGELHGSGAQVTVAGSIAYTAQDPWICHATYAQFLLSLFLSFSSLNLPLLTCNKLWQRSSDGIAGTDSMQSCCIVYQILTGSEHCSHIIAIIDKSSIQHEH